MREAWLGRKKRSVVEDDLSIRSRFAQLESRELWLDMLRFEMVDFEMVVFEFEIDQRGKSSFGLV